MAPFCLSTLSEPEGLRSFFRLRRPTFDPRDVSFLSYDDGLLLLFLLPLRDMYRIFPARFLARRSSRFLDGHGISVQFNRTSAIDGSLLEYVYFIVAHYTIRHILMQLK